GKRRPGLAEAQIAQTDLVEDLQFRSDSRNVNEEGERFADSHLQDVVNVLAVIMDFEDAAFVTRAAAFFADKFDIGEKLHLHGDGAVALTSLAAAAGDIERKVTGGVAAALGVRRIRKDFADGVEGFHVRGGIRTRRAADGRLVHNDDLFDEMVAFEFVAKLFFGAAVFLRCERAIKDVVYQSGFSGTADACDYDQRTERDHQINILQIVKARAVKAKEFSGRLVAHVRNRNSKFPAQIFSRKGFLVLKNCRIASRKEQFSAELACARTEIDDVAGGLNGIG